jgi:Fibronectin type III-like domain/Glycosyl hydrolase family 3 C-terminal domain
MVLLRNENSTLPLSKGLKKVAVIGPLADSARDVEGGWAVEGLFGPGSKSHPVTVLDGIKNKLGSDAQVTLVAGPKPSKVYPGMRVGETTEATVDVTNAGSVAGDAVAQIYIHQRYGSASRPVRQLKGFERIALQPGETKTLKFPLGSEKKNSNIRIRRPSSGRTAIRNQT